MSVFSLIVLAISGLLTCFIAVARKQYTAFCVLMICEALLVVVLFMKVF